MNRNRLSHRAWAFVARKRRASESVVEKGAVQALVHSLGDPGLGAVARPLQAARQAH